MRSLTALLQRCYSVVTDLDLTVCLFTITCINTRHGVWPYPANKKNFCITFLQCWANVEDVGLTLYKCYTNVLCFWVLWARRLRRWPNFNPTTGGSKMWRKVAQGGRLQPTTGGSRMWRKGAQGGRLQPTTGGSRMWRKGHRGVGYNQRLAGPGCEERGHRGVGYNQRLVGPGCEERGTGRSATTNDWRVQDVEKGAQGGRLLPTTGGSKMWRKGAQGGRLQPTTGGSKMWRKGHREVGYNQRLAGPRCEERGTGRSATTNNWRVQDVRKGGTGGVGYNQRLAGPRCEERGTGRSGKFRLT